MNEVWKPIKDYEGKYEISNFGIVKSLERWSGTKFYKREKMLNLHTNKRNGYVYVWLNKNGAGKFIRVHKLVAETFLNNDSNYTDINHKDYNRTNNNVTNLEYCTRSYNIKHSYENNNRKSNLVKWYKNSLVGRNK